MNQHSQIEQPLRIIISGGGTGGHVFPAIAIANALKTIRPDADILFVGAKGRIEMEKVPDAGYRIIGLNISGLHRKLTLKNVLFPFKLLGSILKSRKIIRQFKPDIAIGVGGYASGPLLYVASKTKMPVLIQEQNSYPGITNKMLGHRADKICVAYDGMQKFFPKERIIKTGNPVRALISRGITNPEEYRAHFQLKEKMPVVLVIGGSLGARTINQSVERSLKKWIGNGLQVIWQTGKFYFKDLKHLAEDFEGNVKIFDFITRMDLAYSAADIIVSRAGAIAISELCVVGKPVILIPSPNVAEDHQTKNALALLERKATAMISDAEAPGKLCDEVLRLVNEPALRTKMSNNIRQMAIPDASDRIAEEVLKLIENKNKNMVKQ